MTARAGRTDLPVSGDALAPDMPSPNPGTNEAADLVQRLIKQHRGAACAAGATALALLDCFESRPYGYGVGQPQAIRPWIGPPAILALAENAGFSGQDRRLDVPTASRFLEKILQLGSYHKWPLRRLVADVLASGFLPPVGEIDAWRTMVGLAPVVILGARFGIAEVFLRAGAAAGAMNTDRQTALFHARVASDVRALVRKGCPVDALDVASLDAPAFWLHATNEEGVRDAAIRHARLLRHFPGKPAPSEHARQSLVARVHGLSHASFRREVARLGLACDAKLVEEVLFHLGRMARHGSAPVANDQAGLASQRRRRLTLAAELLADAGRDTLCTTMLSLPCVRLATLGAAVMCLLHWGDGTHRACDAQARTLVRQCLPHAPGLLEQLESLGTVLDLDAPARTVLLRYLRMVEVSEKTPETRLPAMIWAARPAWNKGIASTNESYAALTANRFMARLLNDIQQCGNARLAWQGAMSIVGWIATSPPVRRPAAVSEAVFGMLRHVQDRHGSMSQAGLPDDMVARFHQWSSDDAGLQAWLVQARLRWQTDIAPAATRTAASRHGM